MNLWQEPKTNETQASRAQTVEVAFRIDCARLPVDHAAELAHTLCAILPWLSALPLTGIQAVHVAGSQNGWERPASGEWLILSKRTRLRIRIQREHAGELIRALQNQRLSINGQQMLIISSNTRELVPTSTLFSRYTCFNKPAVQLESESQFVSRVVAECEKTGVTPTKLLCGKTQAVDTPQGQVTTRSVLLADIPAEQSIQLQDHGIGDLRLQGCGVLIPHKDTGAV
jgi:CRISPR-associated protein Cas6